VQGLDTAAWGLVCAAVQMQIVGLWIGLDWIWIYATNLLLDLASGNRVGTHGIWGAGYMQRPALLGGNDIDFLQRFGVFVLVMCLWGRLELRVYLRTVLVFLAAVWLTCCSDRGIYLIGRPALFTCTFSGPHIAPITKVARGSTWRYHIH
jgi:hypothetical protein